MRVAIMQPTWLSWSGYFDLIDQVDAFVFLDTVQFRRRSWQCRNVIKTQDGLRWISMPVANTGRDATTISGAVICPTNHIGKWVRTVRHAYRRARCFEAEFAPFETWLRDLESGESLADVNISFIETVMARLDISTPTYRASELPDHTGRVDRLISIAAELGADAYVSAPGSADYLRDERDRFTSHGLELLFHRYDHPMYRQCHGGFKGYTSVVDLLLNHGPDSARILRFGRRDPIPAADFFNEEPTRSGEKNGEIEAA